MFRRLIASLAILVSLLSVTPQVVSAEPAGGVTTDASTKMGLIAAGDGFTCTIVNSGQVACWGRGNTGSIGDGSYVDRPYMTLVSGITTATQISAGSTHVCARLADSTVKCWGTNTYGQLGNGNQSTQASPVAVCAAAGCASGLTGVVQVSTGTEHSCAVISGGTVKCWGRGNSFRLGASVGDLSTTPVAVTGVTDAARVDAGPAHTCIVRNDKTMRCWGLDNRGSLGDGAVSNSAEEVSVIASANAVAVFSGTTCAINDADSKVRCWGSNTNGQHGVEGGGPGYLTYDTSDHALSASTAKYGSDITAVAVAGTDEAACAVTTSATVICWGALLLTGNSRAGASPGFGIFGIEPVSGISNAVAVTMGNDHACALLSTDAIKCWGDGVSGQMGRGDYSASTGAAVTVTVPVWRTMSFPALSDMTTASADQALNAGASPVALTTDYTTSAESAGVCSIESPNGLDYSVRVQGAGQCTIHASSIGASQSSTYYSNASAVSRTFTITAVSPVVTVDEASSVTSSGALLSGSAHPARASSTTSFSYGTKADLSDATTVAGPSISLAIEMSSVKPLSTTLTGLKPGTKYYFAISAVNANGTSTSATRSFTTLGSAPTVVTGDATSVMSNKATLNAAVRAGGLATTVWFVFGQKSDLSDGTRIDYREVSDLTAVDVAVTAPNLSESVRYYFRVEASNALGSAKGDIKSFNASRPVGISVNDAAEFTNKKAVTIFATGPSGATQVIISNDGGFKSNQTFSLTDGYAEIPWTLVASRDERLPKTVYARFMQRFGTQSSNYSDDIILDTTAPVMNSASGSSTSAGSGNVAVAAVRAPARGGVKLTIRAKDANSGIGKVQVKGSAGGRAVDVATGSPKASSRTVKVNTTKKKLWVRVVDRAGNVSKWVTVTVK